MNPDPSVCAIMLTANRPEMARQAVEFFRAQTYQNKRLLVFDTGSISCIRGLGEVPESAAPEWHSHRAGLNRGDTIGSLRNESAQFPMAHDADILIHFDDDDYSHPKRIAEQVALLQSTGADCVGYRDMLFWRGDSEPGNQINGTGEAWLYTNSDPRYCLGTSLCYWRAAWERRPFEATSIGEDAQFCAGLKCVGASMRDLPRMIARIHSGNTSGSYRSGVDAMGNQNHWTRVPPWDDHCRDTFAAKDKK